MVFLVLGWIFVLLFLIIFRSVAFLNLPLKRKKCPSEFPWGNILQATQHDHYKCKHYIWEPFSENPNAGLFHGQSSLASHMAVEEAETFLSKPSNMYMHQSLTRFHNTGPQWQLLNLDLLDNAPSPQNAAVNPSVEAGAWKITFAG